jgi:predicted lipase
VLGLCAGYAYADIDTFGSIIVRLGLEQPACVCISQTVDAMYIFSTAYLAQSRCGRVVILSYRGTQMEHVANWLGDAELGSESSLLPLADGAQSVRVHAGFHRNTRATYWQLLQELEAALDGKSLVDHAVTLEHPLEALYVTGHSLGGAMALLLALMICANSSHEALASRLRAVYTFGQPMALAPPLPAAADALQAKLVRYVLAGDPMPAFPPKQWGPFVHIGQEYRYAQGEWRRADAPVEQMASLREIPRAAMAFLAPRRRSGDAVRYTLEQHAPHNYITALRPQDRMSEFGD